MNEIPEFYCNWCQDYRYIEHFDASTDGLIGHSRCPKFHGIVYKGYVDVKFPHSVDAPPF